ncbi:hypothetical protein DSO57_1034418 [Entomophthora muscae]|uniref:Uncharacterized protein n=1 Tax=Entomophthora muscae TaxID=34485 RepID=A0ACC2UK95_9FUNG|nr:hypothetical protein DSO57_1034418 [Entomophthora muscae]
MPLMPPCPPSALLHRQTVSTTGLLGARHVVMEAMLHILPSGSNGILFAQWQIVAAHAQ